MTPTSFKSLGFALTVQAPSTVEEFDANAKKPGACLEAAIDTIIFRSISNVFRDRFLHGYASEGGVGYDGIDKKTGIERKFETRPAKSAEGKPTDVWTESEAVYWNRVVAQLVAAGTYPNQEAVVAAYQAFAQEVVDGILFDASEAEKAARGPKRIGKEYLAAAQKYIELGKGDKLSALLSKKLGREVPVTVDGLALAIKEDTDRENAKRMEKLMNQALA